MLEILVRVPFQLLAILIVGPVVKINAAIC